jgi:competence factor transporting protein
VLLFDEATNALDLVTEMRILGGLRELGRRTLVFVSHRATVAAFCEEVAVLEQGRVVVRGDYSGLAARESCWRALFEETATRPLG